MLIHETKRAVQALGMTARYRDGEWRVTFPIENIAAALSCDYTTARDRSEAMAYYTNDAEDALDTARAMKQRGY